MNEARRSRKEMLDWINMISFAVDDVKLFLDSHPDCQEALEYFQDMKAQRVQALKEYAKYYGPLTIDTADPSCMTDQRWMWIDEPWPWQEGGC
ncbi:MAG TPA: spore coat protein CotJB [Candidatus Dorea gallistercoris]|uniref:Spore coat protein CotJB n=1 Tax=Candidatus Dorea gallistercoris TaxID=2838542 RepID=A0A9D1UDU1_9FIRM|nr:spore coat protein CotJB [Candidatus Dorea gallistercoris]